VKENYRLVVEATGSPTGFALAQRMTEPRGTLLLKSTFHGAASVETWPIVVKRNHGRRFAVRTICQSDCTAPLRQG